MCDDGPDEIPEHSKATCAFHGVFKDTNCAAQEPSPSRRAARTESPCRPPEPSCRPTRATVPPDPSRRSLSPSRRAARPESPCRPLEPHLDQQAKHRQNIYVASREPRGSSWVPFEVLSCYFVQLGCWVHLGWLCGRILVGCKRFSTHGYPYVGIHIRICMYGHP